MTEITFIEDFTHIYKELLQGGITPENIRYTHAELRCLFEQYFHENETVQIKATEKALADMKVSVSGVFKELADMINMPFGEYEEMECEYDEEYQGINDTANA